MKSDTVNSTRRTHGSSLTWLTGDTTRMGLSTLFSPATRTLRSGVQTSAGTTPFFVRRTEYLMTLSSSTSGATSAVGSGPKLSHCRRVESQHNIQRSCRQPDLTTISEPLALFSGLWRGLFRWALTTYNSRQIFILRKNLFY